MKEFLGILLLLGVAVSVHGDELLCSANDTPVNCTCDLSRYTEYNTPPAPTFTCSNGTMAISIKACQLLKSKYYISNLALLNNTGPECEAQEYLVNGEPQMVFHNPLSLGKCGNQLTYNGTQAFFSNLLFVYAQPQPTLISRLNKTFSLSCYFNLSYTVALGGFTPKPSITVLQVPGGLGSLTVTMRAYTDSSFSAGPITGDTTLTVEQPIYLSIDIPNLDANTFSVKVLRIYATGDTDTPVYNLTTDPTGCPNPIYGSDLMTVVRNGNSSEARFIMKVFKITDSITVNLKADVTLCSQTCTSDCQSRSGKSSDTPTSQVATLSLDFYRTDLSNGASARFYRTSALVGLLLPLLCWKFL